MQGSASVHYHKEGDIGLPIDALSEVNTQTISHGVISSPAAAAAAVTAGSVQSCWSVAQ